MQKKCFLRLYQDKSWEGPALHCHWPCYLIADARYRGLWLWHGESKVVVCGSEESGALEVVAANGTSR